MTYLLNFLTQRKFTAKLLTLVIITVGVLVARGLPLAEKPRLDFGSGKITTVYPGATAQDVESNVTSKIEKELLTISGIKEFASTSETGLSVIDFDLHTNVSDTEAVYQDIRDALGRITDLPSGVTEAPKLSVFKSHKLDFMVVGISGEVPYSELRKKAKNLELALRQLDGIGEVHPIDLRAPEFLIQLEPISLKRYGLIGLIKELS